MQYILLLEDDDLFREIVADLLSGEGYMVVEADSARKALELAQDRPFHLILSDVRMAGEMDGVGAIEAIQKIQPQIRSVVMTGFADLEVPLRAARIKADDYLLKPFELRDLVRIVRTLLQSRREPSSGMVGRLLQSARQAGRWLVDRASQEVERQRNDFYQEFFVLLRSGRMSADEAYPVFLEVEQRERLGTKATDYPELRRKLVDSLGGASASRPEGAVPWPQFQRLYQRIREGRVDAALLLKAFPLLHAGADQKMDLSAYAAWCLLWEEEPPGDAVDPFIGLRFGQYRLERCLLGVSQVRLYSLTRGEHPCPGRILCFPIEHGTEALQRELDSGRAEYLKEAYGHTFIFCDGDPGVTALARLTPPGTAWADIWRLLRPMFGCLQQHHQNGQYSGCFTAEQVRFGAEGEVTIVDFGPDWFRRTHFFLHTPDQELPPQYHYLLSAAPEALQRDEPIDRSDQFVAGRILLEALRVPSPELQLLDESAREQLWKQVEESHGAALRQVLERLCQPDPAARFADLGQAVEALDGVSASATCTNC